MPYLEKSHGKIFYEVQGDGPPVVLLRGLGRSVRHWLGFDKRMSDLGYKTICIDARGLGRSHYTQTMPHSIFDLAEDVKDVLITLGVPRAHIVGISLGGMIAMALGIKHPETGLSLTLINSSVGGYPYPRLTLNAVRALVLGMTVKRHQLHELLGDVLLSKKLPITQRVKIIEDWKRIEALEGRPRYAALVQLFAAARFMPLRQLSRMTTPTLIIYGKDDRFVPIWNSKMLHRIIRNSQLVGLDDTGHEATLDNPELVSSEVMKFLKTLSP